MNIPEERQAELDELSIRVYQQLQAGYPITAIRSQFDNIEDINDAEVRWILDNGRARYNGYHDSYRWLHRNDAKWTMLGCSALFLIILLALNSYGWPSNVRGRGVVRLGLLLGLGGTVYGIWSWFTANLEGRRSDVKEL